MITHAFTPRPVDDTALAQWRRRVFRISSLCQLLFGGIWVSDAIRPYLPFEASLALFVALVGFAIAVRRTRGTAPRPTGSAARPIERRITIATVVQIVAAVVLPIGFVVCGQGAWVMPVIVASVGALFVWLDREVHLTHLRRLGTALVVVPIATFALPAGAQSTVLLAIAGSLMIATGIRGIATLS